MKRDKFGEQYYTLIGGHVEIGESLEKALFREVHEESMIRISKPRLVYTQSAIEPYGTQYIYLCHYESGVPMLHPNSEEREINKGGKNIYTPMWLPLSQLSEVAFLPTKLRDQILSDINNGFPEEPQTIIA